MNNTELDAVAEIAFPAGGGCRIEENGRIKIWFDILPELKEAKIYLTPQEKSNDGRIVSWMCDGNGRGKELINRYLTNSCNVDIYKNNR